MAGDGAIADMATGAPAVRAAGSGWVRARFALMAVVAALLVVTPMVSTRPASWSELTGAVATGKVQELRVNGALPAGATGSSLVQIFWQDGAWRRVTQVVQQSDDAAGQAGQLPQDQHVAGDLVGQLRRLDSTGSLQVHVSDEGLSSGPTIAGWQLPLWFGLSFVVVWLAVIAVIMHGPEPWWATRWAWFWMVFSPLAPLAVPLFLLVVGPPPGVPRPEQPGRRLTGGWAFLIVSVIASTWRALT
jgi:hypothetical protein